MINLVVILVGVIVLLQIHWRRKLGVYEELNKFNEDRIGKLSNELKDIKATAPIGVQNLLCDRWNPFHNTATWYLEECKKDVAQFTLHEHAHYRNIVKTGEKYQLYRRQELQGRRNNSTIWEKGWCDKWSEGLGAYGLGHDHWSPGRFQYEYDTNKEFAAWLDTRK